MQKKLIIPESESATTLKERADNFTTKAQEYAGLATVAEKVDNVSQRVNILGKILRDKEL